MMKKLNNLTILLLNIWAENPLKYIKKKAFTGQISLKEGLSSELLNICVKNLLLQHR